jgi:hypothetical protein
MNFSNSLSRYILPNTSEPIFWRGVEYAKQKRVKETAEDDKTLSAIVAGSEPYQVELRKGTKYVTGYCSCPYASREDYCKHVVALAVYWDQQKGIDLPTKEEVEETCVQIEYGFGRKIEAMFQRPLHADLQLLATASDYGTWVRPHAKIAIQSPFKHSSASFTKELLQTAFHKIARLGQRAAFDPYFCAGEVSAVLSLAYDDIIKRLVAASKEDFLEVVAECIIFYYTEYLQMIDGSDGVWQIPLARIHLMMQELKQRDMTPTEKEGLRNILNSRIQGWGDVLKELESR